MAQKFEKESRIKEEAVPKPALSYLKEEGQSQAKWYREQGLEDISFEAKFKSNNRRISVEFGKDGKLEDIEVEIEFEQLPTEVQQTIKTHLGEAFDRFKIRKVQIQYKESPLSKLGQMHWVSFAEPHAFEIVVKGKKEALPKLWEITFDQAGELVNQVEIVSRNNVHLEY